MQSTQPSIPVSQTATIPMKMTFVFFAKTFGLQPATNCKDYLNRSSICDSKAAAKIRMIKLDMVDSKVASMVGRETRPKAHQGEPLDPRAH